MSDFVQLTHLWWASLVGAMVTVLCFAVFFGLLYKLYIYPEFMSPLRNLPGPKVR